MRRTAYVLFLFILPTVGAARAQGADPKAADAAWERRGTREGTLEAIAQWEAAVRSDPKDVRSLARLAHAYYWLGEVFEDKNDAKARAFDKGAEYGKRALEIDPNDLEAIYWTGDCLGARAGVSSLFTRLFYVTPAKELEQKVLDRDPGYFHGGAHLFWATFHVRADGLAGGKFERSYEHFDRAIAAEPNYLRSHYLYAKWTLLADTRKSEEKKKADRERAREMLERVLATPADALADAVPENEVAQRLARALYEEAFGPAP